MRKAFGIDAEGLQADGGLVSSVCFTLVFTSVTTYGVGCFVPTSQQRCFTFLRHSTLIEERFGQFGTFQAAC